MKKKKKKEGEKLQKNNQETYLKVPRIKGPICPD
jgi:hypothetical protein